MVEYTITFINSYGNERVIGCAAGKNDDLAMMQVWEVIKKFLDDHHYISYYSRVTELTQRGIEHTKWIDVGSHTEFFYVYPAGQRVVQKLIDQSLIEPAFD